MVGHVWLRNPSEDISCNEDDGGTYDGGDGHGGIMDLLLPDSLLVVLVALHRAVCLFERDGTSAVSAMVVVGKVHHGCYM